MLFAKWQQFELKVLFNIYKILWLTLTDQQLISFNNGFTWVLCQAITKTNWLANWPIGNNFRWNLKKKYIFFQENTFQDVICYYICPLQLMCQK